MFELVTKFIEIVFMVPLKFIDGIKLKPPVPVVIIPTV